MQPKQANKRLTRNFNGKSNNHRTKDKHYTKLFADFHSSKEGVLGSIRTAQIKGW